MTFVEYTKHVFPTLMENAYPGNGDKKNAILVWCIFVLTLIMLGLILAIIT